MSIKIEDKLKNFLECHDADLQAKRLLFVKPGEYVQGLIRAEFNKVGIKNSNKLVEGSKTFLEVIKKFPKVMVFWGTNPNEYSIFAGKLTDLYHNMPTRAPWSWDPTIYNCQEYFAKKSFFGGWKVSKREYHSEIDEECGCDLGAQSNPTGVRGIGVIAIIYNSEFIILLGVLGRREKQR